MFAIAPPGAVLGWDIGGSNTKLALVAAGRVIAVRSRPFEFRHTPDDLVSLLRHMAEEIATISASPWPAAHAVTMTAELSRAFRTKREGVAFVLDAVDAAFPLADVRVFAVDGRFLQPAEARRLPLDVAASNWAATARVVAARHPDAILIDIGTTSTDIIPIVGGVVVALGRTDPERLTSAELVYTGALRTPVEAMASHVPLDLFGGSTGVAAEGFALSGDVHLWRGDLAPQDYTCATPDGRPTTRAAAGDRLARAVCADREMLDEAAVSAIADALAEAQRTSVREALQRVAARHPRVRTAVVTGLGAFIGARAAHDAGLSVEPLAEPVDEDRGARDASAAKGGNPMPTRAFSAAAGQCAPAACVALLCEQAMSCDAPSRPDAALLREPTRVGPLPIAARTRVNSRGCGVGESTLTGGSTVIDLVVKLGGGLLRHVTHLDSVLGEIARASRTRRLVIVPGGGPFADAVRETDRGLGLTGDTAHWMAVLAMDQYAHLVASRVAGGVVVYGPVDIDAAIAGSRVPVLAPFQWLRGVDPLPHTWDVTSDSIAAWVAGALGAVRLVLVKPPGASGPELLDPYVATALQPTVAAFAIPGDETARLRAALVGPSSVDPEPEAQSPEPRALSHGP
jgi:(4-(4-[2-(gamma-L-glutamylamino)ethyl]phenoxymethyl)furan-2-yl)methanamine synthase